MAGYLGNIPVPQATMTHETFVATSGQTSFATSGYTPNFLQVFLNGVKLVNGDDFTATNGSDVVLTTGATAGDTVEVLAYTAFSPANTYTQAEVDALIAAIQAGAAGGGTDQVFWENDQTVNTNYTITDGQNAMSAGPITIASGVTVTVGSGETWTVV